MRSYQMEEGYLFIKNKEEFSKLSPSLVDMEQTIDENSFIAKPGTSNYIWVYAGNTYRTVTADKKLELPLEEDISTISWDVYKNDGQFFAQIILFVSFDRGQQQVFNFPKKVESICLALEKNLTKFNELAKESDTVENQLQKMPSTFKKEILFENLNVTVIITFHDPKMLTNSLLELPEDCSVYVKTKFVEDNEKVFTFETKRCYVLTNENEHKLFFLEQTTENGEEVIIKKEIECKNLGDLRESLGESIYRSGILPDLSKTTNLNGTFLSNLQILTDFLSRDKIAASKISPSYTTLIINKGKHKITAVNPLMPTLSPVSPIEKETKSKPISFSIDHGKDGQVLLVQSHPDLLNEKNLLDRLEQKDEEMTEDIFYFYFDFTNIPKKLVFEAERLRQQAAQTWKPLTAQAWLLLVSRLWAFQTALEDENFKLSDPPEPIYACLRQSSLTNFGCLLNALSITQKTPDDQVEIDNKHEAEIKKQWGEVSETKSKSKMQTMTSWKKAFRSHNPKVPVEHGKAIRLLCVDPVGHATTLSRFEAMPILPDNKKFLDSRLIRVSVYKNYTMAISLCLPAASNGLLYADTLVEYIYADDKLSFPLSAVTAKLTVLYSPVFIEKDNWIKKFRDERTHILSTLKDAIFLNGMEYFLKYSDESLPIIRKWITEILTSSTFSEVNASLLFCLNIQQGEYQCRFLVGVGNNIALAVKPGEKPITKIGAMYEGENVAVSLNSLNKPDNLGTTDFLTKLLNPSSTRHEECIQIAIVEDPTVEILLIPGRILPPESFMPVQGENSKLGLRTYTIEEKKSSPIQNVVNALQARRKDLLTNPDMRSAWYKLERFLRVKEEKAPTESHFFPQFLNFSSNASLKSSDDSPQDSDSFHSSKSETVDFGALNNRTDCSAFIKKFNDCVQQIIMLETQETPEFEDIKKSTSSVSKSDQLTKLESQMVTKLWRAALDDEKDLPSDGKDCADIASIPETNWNKIRAKYFLYFQGLTDSIASFVPTPTIGQPKLIEFVHGLGQFYFNELNNTNRNSEAQEILTFSHLLCLLPDEKAILKNINDKLATFEQRYLEAQAPKFWIQLIQLLIFLYLPEKSSLSEDPVDNLELLKSKLTELSGSSLQTTSRSSELRSQSLLTTMSKILEGPSSDYPILYYPL